MLGRVAVALGLRRKWLGSGGAGGVPAEAALWVTGNTILWDTGNVMKWE
jgi:hypothetical protein